jgi:hypothetical protein
MGWVKRAFDFEAGVFSNGLTPNVIEIFRCAAVSYFWRQSLAVPESASGLLLTVDPARRMSMPLGSAKEITYDAHAMDNERQAAEHEQGIIRAFVQASKRERFLGFLQNPKNRQKLTRSLSHFAWFDKRYATPVSEKVDPKSSLRERHDQRIENIYLLLTAKGAGATCWAMSEDSQIDGREIDLRAALRHVNGRQIGTILSCIPGRLGYFESEDVALILSR